MHCYTFIYILFILLHNLNYVKYIVSLNIQVFNIRPWNVKMGSIVSGINVEDAFIIILQGINIVWNNKFLVIVFKRNVD